MVTMFAGSLLLTAFALWRLIHLVLWLSGHAETPDAARLPEGSQPSDSGSIIGLVLPDALLAALGVGSTLRLLYLVLRPSR